MVRIDNARSRNVPPTIAITLPAGTRNTTAENSIANSAADPDADRMFKVNFAAYGDGCGTTGASRWIAPSSPGHANTIVALSSSALNGPYPHSSTKITSRMYGDHARSSVPVGTGSPTCTGCAVSGAG